MRLRGILWKEGVNGLGVRGFHCLPCRQRFDDAARLHDEAYDRRGGWEDRRFADINFLCRCVRRSATTWQVTLAVLYFYAVRLFGWLFYRYDR